MAETEAGELVTRQFSLITDTFAAQFAKEMSGIAYKTLDPKDIDRSAPKFIQQSIKYGEYASNRYSKVATNYLRLHAMAEGVSTAGLALAKFIDPFDTSAFTKRMMGAGVYGYKKKIAQKGIPMRTMPASSIEFKQSVGRLSGDAVTHAFKSGRNGIVKYTQDPDSMADRYTRKTNDDGDSEVCPWCIMLATRDNYRSEQSASFEAHSRCACSPEPNYEKRRRLPTFMEELGILEDEAKNELLA